MKGEKEKRNKENKPETKRTQEKGKELERGKQRGIEKGKRNRHLKKRRKYKEK